MVVERPVTGNSIRECATLASPRLGLGHRIRRWLRHLWIGTWHTRRAFPPAAMADIGAAIAAGEQAHRAEVRFALESSLDVRELWRGQSARERAVEVFAQFHLWDTEENNGVLVYLLWADHRVEIVADRGAARLVAPEVWERACAQVTYACRGGTAVAGVVQAIAIISAALAVAFPAQPDGVNPDELPNRPLNLG